MSRLRFEWKEDRGLACFLGSVRIGVVRRIEEGFSASYFVPGGNRHKFESSGEAEAEIEKVVENFIREAGLARSESIE